MRLCIRFMEPGKPCHEQSNSDMSIAYHIQLARWEFFVFVCCEMAERPETGKVASPGLGSKCPDMLNYCTRDRNRRLLNDRSAGGMIGTGYSNFLLSHPRRFHSDWLGRWTPSLHFSHWCFFLWGCDRLNSISDVHH